MGRRYLRPGFDQRRKGGRIFERRRRRTATADNQDGNSRRQGPKNDIFHVGIPSIIMSAIGTIDQKIQ